MKARVNDIPTQMTDSDLRVLSKGDPEIKPKRCIGRCLCVSSTDDKGVKHAR